MSGKNFSIYIVATLFLFTSISFSQHQITLKPTIGGYIYNSENSLKIMGDENYFLNYGFEVSYENKDLYGYDIQVDYSYIYSSKEKVLEFSIFSSGPDEYHLIFYTDASLSFHMIDFSLKNDLNELFSFGFGPSFSLVNRMYTVDYYDFEDKLASFAVGINASIDIKYPFTENEQYLFLFSSIKFRYLFGLLYDKGLRDLSNYNQHFVTGNFSVGLGYNF